MDALAEAFSSLGGGFTAALRPANFLFAVTGVVLGTAIGVLPGVGPALTISLLMPLTFGLDPIPAFILFGGIYYGAMYGGSTTSILVHLPGESASVVTAIDGFQMARRGRAGAALATAAVGSFIAGTFATLMLMLLAPMLVAFALRFGPPEYFAVMLLALTSVTGMAGRSAPRAFFSLLVGLALGTVGIDLQTGQARFTLGVPDLLAGVDVVIAAIALFAIGEVLWEAALGRAREEVVAVSGKVYMTREEWRRSAPSWLRGSVLGFLVGVLPGAGATVATFLSYQLERRVSKRPDSFGRGAIEGVAGPEAANNASAGGSLVPLLALGIPGSGTTAVMLAAFQMYGLRPGPLLFAQHPDLVWALIASLYLGNAILLVLNFPLIGVFIRLLEIPRPLLLSAIVVFSVLGVYSLNGSVVELVVLLGLGAAAFFLRLARFPLAPVVLGVVLGPLIEQELRRSLTLSAGDPSIFVTRPISLFLIALSLLSLAVPLLARRRGEEIEKGRPAH